MSRSRHAHLCVMATLAPLALTLLVACATPTEETDSSLPADSAVPVESGAADDALAPRPAEIDAPPEVGTEVDTAAPPEGVEAPPLSTSATIIKGLTCGLMHTLSYTSASCEGYRTSSYSSISETVGSNTINFSRKSTGDWGASSGNGFYHFTTTGNDNVSSSSTVMLPRGTACGLGHSKNYSSAYCYNVSTLTSCPSGWSWKGVYDTSASGGYWFWCEYQDPNSKCTSSSCYGSTNYVPQGTACGLGHNDYYYGTCVTSTISSSSKCPSGYTFRGWYDRGASSGHGMRWCEKD